VPKSTTLDDPERPLRIMFQNTCIFEPSTKILMKTDLHYQRRICSAMTLVSGNIRFMGIFAGFPGQGASNDSGVIENSFAASCLF